MTESELKEEKMVKLLEEIMTIISQSHRTTLPKVSVTALQIIDYLEKNEYLK